MGGFSKFIENCMLFFNLLFYVCILKFVVHYETIETEIIYPMNLRI